jgi:RimJ/RimL family protein N-acetyltransferase
MEKAASVFLRAEIKTSDAEKIISWLTNKNVTRYLNEHGDTPEKLKHLLLTVPEYLLAYHLNSEGKLLIICTGEDEPIGFIKFSEIAERHYEIVFVIGEESLWGLGCGTAAVRRALATAFFEWRAKKVTAKIYTGNTRSVRTVSRCGFSLEKSLPELERYAITLDQYLKRA